jgi:hypothetical protein
MDMVDTDVVRMLMMVREVGVVMMVMRVVIVVVHDGGYQQVCMNMGVLPALMHMVECIDPRLGEKAEDRREKRESDTTTDRLLT